MITNDSRYVSHHVIHADITRVYKQKAITLDDVMEWCAIVETRYIPDVDMMVRYEQIDLVVDTDNHLAILPCNVFRLLDVYSDPDDDGSRVKHYNDGVKLILPSDYTSETVYINFIGSPLTSEGEPLIIKGHENACETFCKIQIFEEDVAMKRFDANLWAMWNEKFSGQCTAAKNNFRHFDRDHFNKLIVIRGNMIPKIGVLSLHHNLFNTDNGAATL